MIVVHCYKRCTATRDPVMRSIRVDANWLFAWFGSLSRKNILRTSYELHKSVIVNIIGAVRSPACRWTNKHWTYEYLSYRESRAYDTQATRAKLGESVGACIVRRDPKNGELGEPLGGRSEAGRAEGERTLWARGQECSEAWRANEASEASRSLMGGYMGDYRRFEKVGSLLTYKFFSFWEN